MTGLAAIAFLFAAGDAQGKELSVFAGGEGASNGYFWQLHAESDRHGRQVELVLRRDDSTAVYVDTRPAKVNRRRISADFGELGRVSFRFEQDGEHNLNRHTCDTSSRFGEFRGLLRFVGESGYTSVSEQRTFGIVALARGRCGQGPVPFANRAGRDKSSILVTCPGRSTSLLAVERRPEARPFFIASAFERAGSLAVYRTLFVEGTARNFAVGRGRRTAAVRPPQPFLGRPKYESGFLAGRLRAMLPGAGLTQLAPAPAQLTSLRGDIDLPGCTHLRGLLRTHTEAARVLSRALGR